jgi:hypothetical protein
MQQDWSDKMRELKNVAERLALLSGDAEVVVTEADVENALPWVKAVKSEFSRSRQGSTTNPTMRAQGRQGVALRRTRTRNSGERGHATHRGLLRGWVSGPRPPNHHRRLRGRREVCAEQRGLIVITVAAPDPIRAAAHGEPR